MLDGQDGGGKQQQLARAITDAPIYQFCIFFYFVQKAFEVTFTFYSYQRLFEKLKKKTANNMRHPKLMIGYKQKWNKNYTN